MTVRNPGKSKLGLVLGLCPIMARPLPIRTITAWTSESLQVAMNRDELDKLRHRANRRRKRK